MGINTTEVQSRFRREELRGLFALGLLAIVASIRLQNSNIIFEIEQTTHDVTALFDVVLIAWSLYAFFMVIGLSEDILGKKASDLFLKISTQYLYLSFVFIGFFSAITFNSIYPGRAIWIFAFVGVTLGYFVIKWIYSLAKGFPELGMPSKFGCSMFFKKAIPKIKNNIPSFVLGIFFNCFLLILYGLYEELVVPSFIVGSVCLVVFLLLRDFQKEEETLDY